jgi:tRNA A-37 threonylcarbamoyl transferase component Bud32
MTPYPGDESYCSIDGTPTDAAAPAAGLVDPNEGKVLGTYRLVKLLGEGGMGKVYLAEHIKLKRKVAIKMLHEQYAVQKDVVSRFFGEAQIVNQIRHENIIDITDFVELDDKTVFFVMELLQGRDLGAEIKRSGALDPVRVIKIAIQVTNALQAVHEQNVIHRDLKPDNIFLVERGGRPDFVKLLDFGIAKLGAGAGGVSHHTQTGMILGTPYYMSPEQAGGTQIDARSDVYSFGVILYEALTGKVPFRAETYAKILLKHLTEIPPPPHEVTGKDLPAVLESAVLCCLEKEADHRYASMAALRADLEQALDAGMGLSAAGEAAAGAAATMMASPGLGRTPYPTGPGATAGRPAGATPYPAAGGRTSPTLQSNPALGASVAAAAAAAATTGGGVTGSHGAAATMTPAPVPGTPYPVSITNPDLRDSVIVPQSSAGKWVALALLGVLALGGGGAVAAYFVLGPETFGLAGGDGTDEGRVAHKKAAKKDDEGAKKDDEGAKKDDEGAKKDDEGAKKDDEGAKKDDEGAKKDDEGAKKDDAAAKGPATAAAAEMARVKFESAVRGVEVVLDGKTLGTTPFATDLPVSPTPLKVTFRGAGGAEAEADVLVDGPRTVKAPPLPREIAGAGSASKKKKKGGPATGTASSGAEGPTRTAAPHTAAEGPAPGTAKKDKIKSDVKDPFAD